MYAYSTFPLTLLAKMTPEEERREFIIRKYLENTQRSHLLIAKTLDFPRTTVNDAINRQKSTQMGTRRKSGSGCLRGLKMKTWPGRWSTTR